MMGIYQRGDEIVPSYKLVRMLGRGGFGEVWEATGPGGTQAAIKIIGLSSRNGQKEFRAIRLVKHIRHPHLVPIYGFWLKDGLDFTLRLSLARVTKEGIYPWRSSCQWSLTAPLVE